MFQKTIKSPVSRKGTGLHSGIGTVIELLPSKENSGIVFYYKEKTIPALASNITGTKRGTSLDCLSTVEHILSAVYGLGITNLSIKMDGAEPPAFDGSSIEYVRMIKEAGILDQKNEAEFTEIRSEIVVKENGASVSIVPYNGFAVECHLAYPGSFVGKQSAFFDPSINDFENDIAPARTFGFIEEVEALRNSGLALGASVENAVVVLKDGYSCALRFPNELARHKILDIMGDIALAGKRIRGRIISEKAGHRLNAKLVERIINA